MMKKRKEKAKATTTFSDRQQKAAMSLASLLSYSLEHSVGGAIGSLTLTNFRGVKQGMYLGISMWKQFRNESNHNYQATNTRKVPRL